MRLLGAADLFAAARALLAAPEPLRAGLMARMIHEAEAADRYRRRIGRVHPLWGNGTLEAAARGHAPGPSRALHDNDHLACLALVLEALVAHRARPDRRM